MSHTVSIRVFDERQEVSKISLEDCTVLREGIITYSSCYTDFSCPVHGSDVRLFASPSTNITTFTASATGGSQYLLIWSDDEETSDDNELRLFVLSYIGVGKDGDADGVGTLANSAEKSLNYNAQLLVQNFVVGPTENWCAGYCNTKATEITTGTGHLDGQAVFLYYQINTKKLCNLLPIYPEHNTTGTIDTAIFVMQNKNKRRIHYKYLEVS